MKLHKSFCSMQTICLYVLLFSLMKTCCTYFFSGPLLVLDGRQPGSRTFQPPIFLTAAEEVHHRDDHGRSLASLKAEFLSLLQQLPSQLGAQDLLSTDECSAHTGTSTGRCLSDARAGISNHG